MKQLLTSYFLLFTSVLFAQKITPEQYIEQYKHIAIREMKHYGIPASITMAQGLLESDNGNSKLAVKAKNHFGIKCTSDWKGKRYHYDDDTDNECFRKYKHDEDSYADHSEFLKTRPRYSFLFELESDDYKGWAHGLKKAGYATNPKYPQLLINLIVKYNLHELDNGKYKPKQEYLLAGLSENNGVKFVTLKSGQSLQDIANQYNLTLWHILRYNDLTRKSTIQNGDKIYVQAKRRRGKEKYHIVDQDETTYSISQDYAIRLKKLYQRNRMQKGTEAAAGERLWLRGKREHPPMLATEEVDKPIAQKISKSKQKAHTVEKGDTLYSVSKKYGLSVSELKKINNLSDDTLDVGQRLVVGY